MCGSLNYQCLKIKIGCGFERQTLECEFCDFGEVHD